MDNKFDKMAVAALIFGCPGHERRTVDPRRRAVNFRARVGENAGGAPAGPRRLTGAEPVGGRLRLPGRTVNRGGPGGTAARRLRGTGRESHECGDAPPALVGVPLLARTVPGPSSPGRVHRRHLRGLCRCVSRGMCWTSLGDAFGREQRLRKGGRRNFLPAIRSLQCLLPVPLSSRRDRGSTKAIEWP